MVNPPRHHHDPHCYDAHIFDSGQAVRPKNPYFLWRTYRRRPRHLSIPNGMKKEYKHLKKQKSLLIIDEGGRKWDTKIIKQDSSLTCSSIEWGRMCTANRIAIGDICICEFVQGCSGLDILVRVIRAPLNKCRNRELKYPQWSDAEIFEAGLAVRPNNPYFLWRPGNLKHNRLYIPRSVKNAFNHLRIQNSLFLIDERGNKWKAKIMKGHSSSLECSSIGWQNLCAVNLVVAGDICICEIVQGRSGLDILVHVIRSHKLTRKNGFEEEEVEQADKESMLENDSDENDGDESGMHGHISKAKCKFMSVSSFAPIRRSPRKKNAFEEDEHMKIDEEVSCSSLPSNNDNDDSDGDETSWVPVRRSARKDFGRKESSEEDGIERIHEHDLCEEMRWKSKDAQQRTIEDRDVRIKKLKGIIITLVSKDVHRGTPMGCLPEKLELLRSYFKLVHDKKYLPISLNDDVFGKKYRFYIFLEAINKFCLLKPISDGCIIAYILYLHAKMKKKNIFNRFLFVNPNYISYLSTKSERVCALLDRFNGASTNQLMLVPCNVGNHWILTVIDPYNNVVFLLDPLSHRIRDEVWQDVVNEALCLFSASKGEKETKLPNWEVIKAPLQPDTKQCGFYVMRYMSEIIEFSRDLGLSSLQSMFAKKSYLKYEIDEVRAEWAECVLDKVLDHTG